jgi:menaquinone-dependent protoporphyrinogen oxidase
MASILLIYSTVDGHTRGIAERMRASWSSAGHQVTLTSLDEDPDPDPAPFDHVVIGASIRYGKHRPNVAEYVNRHAESLQGRPGAFFTVNLVARKPGRNDRETNPYLRKFLASVRWAPDPVAAFAGKLNYPSYGFLDRQVIRLIMWITKGPTESTAVVDFTDWQAVEDFARACVAAEARPSGQARAAD